MTKVIEKLLTSGNESDVLIGINLLSKYKIDDIINWYLGICNVGDKHCDLIVNKRFYYGNTNLKGKIHVDLTDKISIWINCNYIFLLKDYERASTRTHTL